MRTSRLDNSTLKSADHRHGSAHALIILMLVGGVFAGAWVALKRSESQQEAASEVAPADVEGSKRESNKRFPVVIRKPSGPPKVYTGINDVHGNEVTVSCSTCHKTRVANFENKTAADLNEFHGSLTMAHGNISCLSCHNSEDYDTLKLADDSRIAFPEVMQLCAQCHGQQMRDYEHGAHGGYNGYWDLTRGPRERLNCVDCHHPHSPQFPQMKPGFKPRDRFLHKEGAHE